MTEWYVKDLSKLTQVSVQTLHHYDRINLLKPSVRLTNGYRLYSEKDLLKLQQIIALKFFGFELSQIKMLLAAEVDIVEHFASQARFLEEKAQSLIDASKTLKSILSDCQSNKSIPWETIIKIIEVYRMTQLIENKWVAEALNAQEIKDYAKFEKELQTRFTSDEKKACEPAWQVLVSEVHANLKSNPTSDVAIALGKRCMDWVNKLYGKKYANLRTSIWEKAFKGGHGAEEHGLSKEGVIWLDQAMDAYYQNRISNALKLIDSKPPEEALKLWQTLLNDMYGDDQHLKNDFLESIIQDESVSQTAKNWLKQITN